MNWEATGAIGEILGAIGVIVTLIYLATQIRHNSRSVKASTYQEIYRDLERRLSAIPLDIRDKTRAGEELTPEEESLFHNWSLITMRAYENWWQQREYGILDPEIFDTYISHMRLTLSNERMLRWWHTRQVDFLPGFVRYVEDFQSSNAERSPDDA